MIFMLFQCKKYSGNKILCLPTEPEKYSDVSENRTFIFFGLIVFNVLLLINNLAQSGDSWQNQHMDRQY